MSRSAGKAVSPDGEAFADLERAVGRVLERLSGLRARLASVERRREELEEIVGRLAGNPEEAGRIVSDLTRLETENTDLHERLREGREGVDRILAKIRFLEDQR